MAKLNVPTTNINNATFLLSSNDRYKLELSKQYSGFSVMLDDTSVFIIPVSLGAEYAKRILGLVHGAYFEGYLQKIREEGGL